MPQKTTRKTAKKSQSGTKSATKRASTRRAKGSKQGSDNVGSLLENVLNIPADELREQAARGLVDNAIPAMLAKLDAQADKSGEWRCPKSGREYVFCPFLSWTADQERRAKELFDEARAFVTDYDDDGMKVFDMSEILSLAMERGLESAFLSCVYVPKEEPYYDPDKVADYVDDFRFMPRAVKLGAYYFFVRSSGDVIVNAIRTFFPEGSPLRKLTDAVLNANG